MIKRRTFIAGLGSAAAWPMVARAQQSFPVIGWLWSGTPDGAQKYLDAFLSGLAESGYVVNKNVRIEYRWAQNKYERLPVLASDLVERHVAVIIGNGLISTLAAKNATAVVPIVFNVGADPIKSGLVTSLNRPRGNLTGVAALIEALGPKRLELVHDLLPDARYIGVLFNDSNPTAQTQVEELKIAAASKGVVLQPISIQDGQDLDETFSQFDYKKIGAVIVVPEPTLIDNRERVVALAANYAIPAIYPIREFAEAGGLVSYGSDFIETLHQSGIYAGRILSGAKPADLPVVQSAKLELIVNLKTAKELNLMVPPKLLARADEVIE